MAYIVPALNTDVLNRHVRSQSQDTFLISLHGMVSFDGTCILLAVFLCCLTLTQVGNTSTLIGSPFSRCGYQCHPIRKPLGNNASL